MKRATSSTPLAPVYAVFNFQINPISFNDPERPESWYCTKDEVWFNILRPPHKYLAHSSVNMNTCYLYILNDLWFFVIYAFNDKYSCYWFNSINQHHYLSHNLRSRSVGTQCRKSHKCTSVLSIFVAPLRFNNVVTNGAQMTSFVMTFL